MLEKIHKTFNTEVNRLLKDAETLTPISDSDLRLLEKAHTLKELGFENAKEVKKGNDLIKIAQTNQIKERTKKAINYFSQQYPQYKFITEDSVRSICDKYRLTRIEVKHYIGEVPDKCLQHLIDFKIKEEDKAYYSYFESSDPTSHSNSKNKNIVNYHQYKLDLQNIEELNAEMNRLNGLGGMTIIPCHLEICVNASGFDLFNRGVNKIIPINNHPVVLQPVLFEGQKYYLIVTYWSNNNKNINKSNEI